MSEAAELKPKRKSSNRTTRNWNSEWKKRAVRVVKLLIAPQGIEIWKSDRADSGKRTSNRTTRNWNAVKQDAFSWSGLLLIAPQGIEIKFNPKVKFLLELLIAPQGIEIMEAGGLWYHPPASNRTTRNWNVYNQNAVSITTASNRTTRNWNQGIIINQITVNPSNRTTRNWNISLAVSRGTSTHSSNRTTRNWNLYRSGRLIFNIKLLIAPQGIEIRRKRKHSSERFYLLIAPQGIEIT